MQEIPAQEPMKQWTLMAVHALGGSGHNREIEEKVRQLLNLSDDVTDQIYPGSRQTILDHRTAFARSHLKRDGLLDNPQRSVWTLTEAGVALVNEFISQMNNSADLLLPEAPEPERAADTDDEAPAVNEDEAWKEDLLTRILQLSPGAFERLCQRLLRESGFVQVQVSGRAGDGGIDGNGLLQMARLISFPVLFQCKRWQGSVGVSVVREFRGAMSGRADRGLIISTGTFTTEARKEAARDGVPPIDLVDGHALAENLRELKLGVKEVIAVDRDWFDQLESWASGSNPSDQVFEAG